MGLIRDFEGFRPVSRHDGDPFTEVRIEEAETKEGGWTLIETIALSPLDTDPAEPAARDFTTENATLSPAWYRLVWADASGDTSLSDPIYFPEFSWAPSVDDVAAHVRARLKEPGGFEVETFTANTRPTADQVERLIPKGTRAVSSRVGPDPCTDELRDDAKDLAALYVAMVVEQSYYPEQTRNAGSSFQSLRELWDDGIKAFTEQVGETCGGGDGEAVGGQGQSPASWFDDTALIGRNFPAW